MLILKVSLHGQRENIVNKREREREKERKRETEIERQR